MPELVSADLSRSRDIENFDTGIVKLYAGKIPATIMLTHCCGENCAPRMLITCEKGSVYYEENGAWEVRDAAGNLIDGFEYPGKADHRYMFDAVINRISDPSQRICTPELASEHVKLMEQIYKQGEIKTLPENAYTIREEDGVRINNGLAEAWDKIYSEL